MALMNFELVSPERLLISAEVQQVTVPGTEGLFTVMPNHAPVLSTLKPGVVEVVTGDGAQERIFVRGGFAEVNNSGLTVLAEVAIPLAELDSAALDEQVRYAEEDVADAQDDETRRRAQESLDHLRELRQALSRRQTRKTIHYIAAIRAGSLRMSSSTAKAPACLSCAGVSGVLWEAPTKPKTDMPAAMAAAMPVGVSSTTRV